MSYWRLTTTYQVHLPLYNYKQTKKVMLKHVDHKMQKKKKREKLSMNERLKSNLIDHSLNDYINK